MRIDEIISNFELLDEWEDRYRYLIELGRGLEPLSEQAHCEENKVRGCASQVWLETTRTQNEAGIPVLVFKGDSDAHIVKGLIALALTLYSGREAADIVSIDPKQLFEKFGLAAHLSHQRANGLRAMVDRIKAEAQSCLDGSNVSHSP